MEIVTLTILLSVLQSTGWAGFAAASLASGLTYDAVKGLSTSFVKRLSRFFENETQAEEYLKTITEAPAKNIKKPIRDIEDAYEEITNNNLPEDFFPEFKTWIDENKEEIKKILSTAPININTMRIGSQTASRDILNIQGDTTINNK